MAGLDFRAGLVAATASGCEMRSGRHETGDKSRLDFMVVCIARMTGRTLIRPKRLKNQTHLG